MTIPAKERVLSRLRRQLRTLHIQYENLQSRWRRVYAVKENAGKQLSNVANKQALFSDLIQAWTPKIGQMRYPNAAGRVMLYTAARMFFQLRATYWNSVWNSCDITLQQIANQEVEAIQAIVQIEEAIAEAESR